jgi:branched-chain amino acid transport system ATP-binding protein
LKRRWHPAPGTAPAPCSRLAAPQPGGKLIGDVILDVKNISLSFGGVKALTDISFNVREHEIRAIIGPTARARARC